VGFVNAFGKETAIAFYGWGAHSGSRPLSPTARASKDASGPTGTTGPKMAPRPGSSTDAARKSWQTLSAAGSGS
jgi:hypothetical protein